MIFRYSFFNNSLNKFLSEISIKKIYGQILQKKADALLLVKVDNYRMLNLSLLNQPSKTPSYVLKQKSVFNDNLMITYVITLTVTKTNFYLNISDLTGKLKLSVSAGNFKSLRGVKNRKALKISSFNAILKLIYKQKYLVGKPIALHLRNKEYVPRRFLKQLKKKRFLKIITFFNRTPFNGCRKKKVRAV
jgi:hypothetical protein